MVKIYFLQHPITLEIFYVGATTKDLNYRLGQHYRQLLEVQNGNRRTNNRFNYLAAMHGSMAKIILIDEVEKSDCKIMESMYIGLFRSWGFNLTNTAGGGVGGHTSEYLGAIAKKRVGLKISNALKGKRKPAGFAEAMSEKRKGLNNPMGGKTKYEPVAQISNDDKTIKIFTNRVEITQAGFDPTCALRAAKRKGTCGGYKWRFKSELA